MNLNWRLKTPWRNLEFKLKAYTPEYNHIAYGNACSKGRNTIGHVFHYELDDAPRQTALDYAKRASRQWGPILVYNSGRENGWHLAGIEAQSIQHLLKTYYDLCQRDDMAASEYIAMGFTRKDWALRLTPKRGRTPSFLTEVGAPTKTGYTSAAHLTLHEKLTGCDLTASLRPPNIIKTELQTWGYRSEKRQV